MHRFGQREKSRTSFIATLFVVGVTWATLGSLAGDLIVVPLQFLLVGFAVRNFRDEEIEPVR